MLGVVVVGGVPRGARGVGDLVDLVGEEQSPPFGRIGVEFPWWWCRRRFGSRGPWLCRLASRGRGGR